MVVVMYFHPSLRESKDLGESLKAQKDVCRQERAS